jgi:tRNA (guanine37-N1)-methyltransferase
MKIDIITIFPDMFTSPFAESIVKRALHAGKVTITAHNLRKWTTDKYQSVDDTPFGGGAGMIMKIEPIYKALLEIDPEWNATRILLTAKGARIMQEKVRELSQKEHLVFICGHYEGVDHRVFDHLVNERISIGDFVLSGGEIPAMAVIDAVVRLLPGAVGNPESVVDESFSTSDEQRAMSNGSSVETKIEAQSQFLEYPQYTKPAVFKLEDGKELKVPDVLLSGNHQKIREWREENRKQIGN